MRTSSNDPSPDDPHAGRHSRSDGPESVPPGEPDDDVIEFAEHVEGDGATAESLDLVEAPETAEIAEAEEVVVAELIDDDDIPVTEGSPDSKSASPPSTPATPPPPPRQIVLLGAGHTHLQILKWWRRRPVPGTELTLVSAFDHAAYSAMLPSTLATLYRPDEMLIDLPKLCHFCGVRLVVDRANRLEPESRTIEFAHQPTMTFDLASVDIGSVPASEALWQSHRILISVKPLSTFLRRFEVRFRELVEQWRMAPGPEMLQIVVVGAGASGVELALCLEQHKHELELPADVRLVDGNKSILADFSPGTIRRVEKLLKLRGIDRSLGSPVVACDDEGPGHLVLQSGKRVRADLVIWAAGAAPPMALRGFNLPKSPRGFLATRTTLQTTADAPVFVTGDAADFEEYDLPKAGVYAVRQAPVLWHNIRNLLDEKPLAKFHPQTSFLRLLSCGDGTAIMDYKGWTFHNSWAWALKRWIDRRWVRQFQVR